MNSFSRREGSMPNIANRDSVASCAINSFLLIFCFLVKCLCILQVSNVIMSRLARIMLVAVTSLYACDAFKMDSTTVNSPANVASPGIGRDCASPVNTSQLPVFWFS